jgi:very-short-patch-repair endonuclease
LAAVLGAGERSFLSHESLAVHRGLWRYPPPKITVLSPNQRRPEGVLVHRYRSLDPRDVTTHDGIPATTIHRLFVDLSSTLIAEELTNVMYEAAFKGWLVEPAIRDAMARASGHHDLAVVDRALALHASGSAGLRSRAERAFLSLIRANDLPEPRINTHAFGFELDFHWPELKLAVEIDGSGHARPRARDHDGSLDTALRAAGFTVVRFADEAVRFRPAEVLTGLHERLSHD